MKSLANVFTILLLAMSVAFVGCDMIPEDPDVYLEEDQLLPVLFVL